ncbi:phosphatase PAP2 family protein [Qipengyuania sp. DGS5-3]|uniref:phosphatase PAP2 family protein n=1 Tax=Qipengyuania sp. DGS5-3 TaxID=3349632 RepID=UPI0036D33975
MTTTALNQSSRRIAAAMPNFGLSLIVCAALTHFLIALQIGQRPVSSYFTITWVIELSAFLVVPFMLWFVLKLVEAVRRNVPSPIGHITSALIRDRKRFMTAAVLFACYGLVNRSYRAIKVGVPRIEDFWADPMFVQWDRAIFGTDPWTITHAFIGPAGTYALDMLYAVWIVVILLVYAVVGFAKDRVFQLRACFTYLLIWILLGNLLAVIWSSAGPVYYEHFFGDPLFAPLMERLNGQELRALQIQDLLLSNSGDEMIGSGISAMPSIHCAMTALIAILVWERRGFGMVFAVALAYHLAIFVGSVHLAWHYAVDGLVSSALVPLIWFAVKTLVRDVPADKTDGGLRGKAAANPA